MVADVLVGAKRAVGPKDADACPKEEDDAIPSALAPSDGHGVHELEVLAPQGDRHGVLEAS
jgi:hypothetical protein